MRKITALLTKTAMLSIVFLGISLSAFASHFAGSDLFYECLGSNQYRVTLVFYRDCDGISEPTSADILLTNGCTGGVTNLNIPKKANSGTFTNGQEISSTCAGVLSSCSGGTAPGLRKWVYEGIITVPTGCNDWKISYELCCRNGAITTLQNPGSEGLYTECTFKSNICDNAPLFSNNPIGFACANQPFNYNQGAFDSDGDSIAYELDDPLSTGGTPVLFAAGFSKTNPFAVSTAFVLDPVTGAVSFTPNALQVGVFAVKVKQFRNGNLLGYVRRDMEIFVTNCNNNSLPVASGFNGTSNYTVNVCAGTEFCGAINTSDADASQIVTATWNQGIAGATFTVGSGNNPTATVCWTPTAADIATNPNVFTVTVKDNACPTNGEQTFSYVINVIGAPAVSVSTTSENCNGDNGSATVNTGINNTVLWSTGSTNTTINGLTAGTYTVTVTNSTGCSASATGVVSNVNGNISLSSTSGDDDGSCNGSIDLSVNSGSGPYTYSWSNGVTTEDLSGLCAGTYTVNVTDANGCAGTATVVVGLDGGCKISLSLISNDEGFCKTGGIITAKVTGSSGTGTAVLTDGAGSVVATKTYKSVVVFDGLKSDTYVVTVTDASGCTASGSAYVGNGNCGAPVNVNASNVTGSSATVTWDNCYANKHIVRYKQKGSTGPFTFLTVIGATQAQLTNLSNNTIYKVSVRSACGGGKRSQYTIPVLFCTGGCTVPKFGDETDMIDDESEISVSFTVTPNPAANFINITGESNVNKSTQVVFSNILGKVVMTKDINLSDDTFDSSYDISDLPKGVYIINIKGYENFSQRFVKM